jgi:hypothetical protein
MAETLAHKNTYTFTVNMIMIQITFPTNPKVGDDFLAHNGSTYVWMGDRWSGAQAVLSGLASPFYDGEYASSTYNSNSDTTLEGGIDHVIGAN